MDALITITAITSTFIKWWNLVAHRSIIGNKADTYTLGTTLR